MVYNYVIFNRVKAIRDIFVCILSKKGTNQSINLYFKTCVVRIYPLSEAATEKLPLQGAQHSNTLLPVSFKKYFNKEK